jgi:hypothetical protein
MAFRYGNKFRRFFAQAASTASADRRALIERILPLTEGGKRRLRLRTQADCDAAPRAIIAAWIADDITGQEAEELLQKVEKVHESPQERFWSHPDDDPLAESIRAWGAAAGEESVLARESVRGGRCGAANKPAPLVKNSENTSAGVDGAAARETRAAANSLR